MDFYPTVFLLMKTYSSFCLAATKKREKKTSRPCDCLEFPFNKKKTRGVGLISLYIKDP